MTADTTLDAPADAPAGPDPCPRCGGSISDQPFYGPCQACRDTLRAQLGAEDREVAVEAYEPKMNVTPNAVALKDD